MNPPKVSVIVPVYNIEKYIGQCVESIMAQTLREIEIICVNDGATDKSADILQYYALKDSRIIIVNKKNGGLSSARNSGLKKARGEYISYIDGDDWVAPDFLEVMYNAAVRNDADIVRAPYKECFEDKQVDGYICSLFFRKHSRGCALGVNEHSIVVWNSLYKRSFLKKVFENGDCFDETILSAEDIPFTVRTSFLAGKIIPVTGTYYYYRKNVQNQLSVFSVKRSKSIVLANRSVVKFLNSADIKNVNDYLEAFKRVIWRYDNTFRRIRKMKDFDKKNCFSYVRCFVEEFHKCRYMDEYLRKYNEKYYKFLIDRDIEGYINFYKRERIRRFLKKVFSVEKKQAKKFYRILGIKIEVRDKYEELRQDIRNKNNYILMQIETHKQILESLRQKFADLKNGYGNKPSSVEIKSVEKKYKAELEEILKRILPQTSLDYCVIHLVDECNLRCWGCDHFAPLAKGGYLESKDFEKDIKRLSELSGGQLGRLGLMGGEPLLHPGVSGFLSIARKYFPDTVIQLVTNGLLLGKQDDAFWETCRENGIHIVNTFYPVNIDREKIIKKALRHNVRFSYYGNTGYAAKTSYHLPLEIKGGQNSSVNFAYCFHANNCVMLKNGKIFPCTVAPNIEHFNKYFGTEIPLTERDGIDIHKAEDIRQILEFISKPIPFCKYCNIKKRSFNHPWKISGKDISEWTVAED